MELASARPGNGSSQLATRDRNWPARARGTGPGLANVRPWNSPSWRAIKDWNWPVRAWRTALTSARSWIGIGQLATREQRQPARDHGLELASSRSRNGNWPARDQGTGLA